MTTILLPNSAWGYFLRERIFTWIARWKIQEMVMDNRFEIKAGKTFEAYQALKENRGGHSLRARREMTEEGELIIVLFHQNGKEGLLKKLENLWFAKAQYKLAKAYCESLEGHWATNAAQPLKDISNIHIRAWEKWNPAEGKRQKQLLELQECLNGLIQNIGNSESDFKNEFSELNRLAQALKLKPEVLEKMVFTYIQAHLEKLPGEKHWGYFGESIQCLKQDEQTASSQLHEIFRKCLCQHFVEKKMTIEDAEKLSPYLQLLNGLVDDSDLVYFRSELLGFIRQIEALQKDVGVSRTNENSVSG